MACYPRRIEKSQIIVNFDAKFTQKFKNSINTRTSILQVYGGRCVGVSEQVHVVEGTWEGHDAIALFEFPSYNQAVKWLECDPAVRQHDWLSGANIIVAPLLQNTPYQHRTVQLQDVMITDFTTYMDEYVPNILQSMGTHGGMNLVGSPAGEFTEHRGLWHPNFVVINRWPCIESYEDWKYSEENISVWQPLRDICSINTTVVFDLDDLI